MFDAPPKTHDSWRVLGLSPPHAVMLLIAMLTAARLVFASLLGLSYDETYIAAMSRHLSLSYVDHPPLPMLLSAASQYLTGSDGNLAIRLPAILLFAGTTWLIYRIGAMLFGPRAGVWGALLLSLTPMFSFYLGQLAVTDGPLMFALAAATLCICHALFGDPDRSWPLWIGAGIFAGLALLSKYSAGLVIVGLLIFLLTSPHRRWLLTPKPWVAGLIALAVVSPVIIWNAQHDWITFRFQGGRINPSGFSPAGAARYLGIQAMAMLPLTWLLLIASLMIALRRGPCSERTWLLACLAAPPILFFTLMRLVPIVGKGFHWAGPGYLLLFPIAGLLLADIAAKMPRLVRAGVSVTVVMVCGMLMAVAVHITTGVTRTLFPPFATFDAVLWDTADWDDIRQIVDAQPDRSNLVLLGLDWEECAKIDRAMRAELPLLCFAPTALQFPLIADQRNYLGRDALLFTRRPPSYLTNLTKQFGAIEFLPSLPINQFGKPVFELRVVRLRRLHTLFTGQW